jgi:hypothetical protein
VRRLRSADENVRIGIGSLLLPLAVFGWGGLGGSVDKNLGSLFGMIFGLILWGVFVAHIEGFLGKRDEDEESPYADPESPDQPVDDDENDERESAHVSAYAAYTVRDDADETDTRPMRVVSR